MVMDVSKDFKDLIKEFIIITLDTGTMDKIFEFVDNIYLYAKRDADEYIKEPDEKYILKTDYLENGTVYILSNIDRQKYNDIKIVSYQDTYLKIVSYQDAARMYLLASIVLKEGASFMQTDKEVYNNLMYAVMSWQKQVKQSLSDEVIFYTKKAFKYEKEKDYKTFTQLINRSKELEHKIDETYKELYMEVSDVYKSIFNEVIKEFEKSTGKSFLAAELSKLDKSFESEKALPEKSREEPSVTIDQITLMYGHKKTPKDIEWWIYLNAKDNVMEQIESVTYNLHPTFPSHVRTIKDRTQGFILEAAGWSEFQIKIDIHLKNGETITKYHWLDLGIKESRDINVSMPDMFTGG